MAKDSSVFFAFLLLLFVFAISEITIVKGKVCEKPSKTWFGTCKDTLKCDKQCIEWEDALHGACHQREAKYMCFCYNKCGPKASPTPPSTAPPGNGAAVPNPPGPPGGGGGSPPPAEGGGSPPPAEGGGSPPPAEGGGSPPAEGGGSPPPKITIVKGKVCEKPSKTWFGTCKDTLKCDKQCIEWEDALHGACHQREAKYMCFCYNKCGPKESPTPPSTAPPGNGAAVPNPPGPPGGGGGSPPPAEGGGSPPPAGGGGSQPPAEGGGSPPPVEGGRAPPPVEGGGSPPAEGCRSPPPSM